MERLLPREQPRGRSDARERGSGEAKKRSGEGSQGVADMPASPSWLGRAAESRSPVVVDQIFDKRSAAKMGIEWEGQVCVMIHSGSRGLGHQVTPYHL